MPPTGPVRAGLGAGRRFLITGAVSQYSHEPAWNREELAAGLQEIVTLFTRDLGYEHVPLIGMDPTKLEIQDALRTFCTAPDRRRDDYLVVYLAGHGDVLQTGTSEVEHVLLPADAVPADLRRRVIRTGDLAEWILADTLVSRLLLLIDTCYSGLGGMDFTQNAAWARKAGQFGWPNGSGVVVVSATQPRQEAIAGVFAGRVSRAIRELALRCRPPGRLAIDAVVNVINADPGFPPTQRAQWSLVLGNGEIPDFLPYPHRAVDPADLDLANWSWNWLHRRDHEDRRAEELRGQFAPRTDGFIGRGPALTDISCWLEDLAQSRPLIVTGDPGSGKTAVLGILALLSDPRCRPTVPRDGLPAGIVPRAGMIDVSIYAGALASDQVLAALALAAGLDDPDPDPDPAEFDRGVARLLAGLGQRDRPLIAMIDAIDEAADPAHLAGRLLRPLIEQGHGSVRLLLGTRRHIGPQLSRAWMQTCEVIDLDAPRYADPDSLAATVRRILRSGASPADSSPFADCPPKILQTVTSAIAAAAGRSFFVARILAATQATQPLPDLSDPWWAHSLPSRAGPAMRRDLESRLSFDADRALDLLRPLAYAQGAGLPWEDIWPRLAAALSGGRSYTNEDLLWLDDRAGSYLAESGTIADRPVYQLYHRSLGGYLRFGRDEVADERAITAALITHVPRDFSGRLDWAAAHPYIRAHLAAHADRSGTLDALAQDPGFLLAADPPRILTILDRDTVSPAARAAGRAYRRARPLVQRSPDAERLAYLALAAHYEHADDLAAQAQTAADWLGSTWRPLWASWQPLQPNQEITGHDGEVTAVAAAELDGRPVIISGSSDRTIRVWDLATGARRGDPLTGHAGAVRSVTTAQLDGRPVIISGSNDHTIRVWDLADGIALSEPLTGHCGSVTAVAAAKLDGRPVIISGSEDTTVRTWELATGKLVGALAPGHDAPVNAVAAAQPDAQPDGQSVIVSGADDGTMQIWELAALDRVHPPIVGHASSVGSVTTARLGGRVVVISASGDETVRVWDLADGTPVSSPLTGHVGAVNAVTTAILDGRPVLVSGSDDGTLRIWDLAAGAPVGQPAARHSGAVSATVDAELAGRPVVVSGGSDGAILVWDLATREPAGTPLAGHDGWVRSLAAAVLDGQPVIVSGSDDRTIRVWDLATRTLVGTPLTGHDGAVAAVATAELDGRHLIISGSDDQTLRAWDLATGRPIGRPWAGHDGTVVALAATQLDGRPAIVSGSSDSTIRIWDLATGESMGGPLASQAGWVLAVTVAWLDGRRVIVAGCDDGTVRIWDLVTRAVVGRPIAGHDSSVYAVAAAELDGRPVVVSGSDDEVVRVWDLATGAPARGPLKGHAGWVLSVTATCLDGRPVVISGGGDETVRVWDLAASPPAGKVLGGDVAGVNALASAEVNGRRVVISGGRDKAVRVWDLATGQPVGEPMAGHAGAVRSLTATELDGRPIVVSGGDDGTLQLWDLAARRSAGQLIRSPDNRILTVTATRLNGRPVVISGSDNGAVRVWDLATRSLVGALLASRAGTVRSVTTAQLDGRPVIISGSSDSTIQIWDLATGRRSREPCTGPHGAVTSVAVADLDGRPVIVAGSSDGTVWVWDLATGRPAGEPLSSPLGGVTSVAGTPRAAGRMGRGCRTFAVAGIGSSAAVLACSAAAAGTQTWQQVAAPRLASQVLAVAWPAPATFVAATERGIVAIELPPQER